MSPRAVIIKETAHMYQASQADSCALMTCAPRLLDLILALLRAIANAPTIPRLHRIEIDRLRPASRPRESISPCRRSKLASGPEPAPIGRRPSRIRQPSPSYVEKVRHNRMVHPSSKRRCYHVRQGNQVRHSPREPRTRTP